MPSSKTLFHNKEFTTYIASAFCISLAVLSIVLSWSYLITIRVEKNINQWELNNKLFDYQQAEKFESRLKNSIQYNAYNPNTYLLLASLFEIKAQHASDSNKQTLLNLAEFNYIKSSSLRPTWGLSWAKLANFYNNSNFSNTKKNSSNNLKFEAAVIKAMELEPYERATQKVLVPLIFQHWALISNNDINKKQAEKVLRSSVSNNSTKYLTMRLAKKFDRIDLVTPFLKDEKLLIKYQIDKKVH